jgi:hypothetical protein
LRTTLFHVIQNVVCALGFSRRKSMRNLRKPNVFDEKIIGRAPSLRFVTECRAKRQSDRGRTCLVSRWSVHALWFKSSPPQPILLIRKGLLGASNRPSFIGKTWERNQFSPINLRPSRPCAPRCREFSLTVLPCAGSISTLQPIGRINLSKLSSVRFTNGKSRSHRRRCGHR